MGPSQHDQNLVLRKINGKLNIRFDIFAKKVEICDILKKKTKKNEISDSNAIPNFIFRMSVRESHFNCVF
jgi:hypothetical protein